MALKEKVIEALRKSLEPEYWRLEDDDGISGFVVSRLFKDMSAMDRQERIGKILQDALPSQEERRRILMIAALTPNEYDAVGARIRVHQVKETVGGVEILLHGGLSDAEYVRGILQKQKGVQTTNPKPVSGTNGGLITFWAKGSAANALTKEKALRVLKKDQYIEVMENG